MGMFMGQRQQARAVIPDVHAATTQTSKEQFAVNQFLFELDLEQRSEMSQRKRCVEFLKHLVHFVSKILSQLVEPIVHRLATFFQVQHDRF